MDWSHVDYLWIVVRFLSAVLFWRHPFTAEDPLVSRWCNAKFLQICSSEETKLIYILDGLWVSKVSANLHFWVNYSFKAEHATTFAKIFGPIHCL